MAAVASRWLLACLMVGAVGCSAVPAPSDVAATRQHHQTPSPNATAAPAGSAGAPLTGTPTAADASAAGKPTSVGLRLSAEATTPDPLGAQRIEPDGNDDADPSSDPAAMQSPSLPTAGRFVKVGRAPASLRQICDLTPLGDALYAAHALSPLGADGASISRYRPSATKRPFALAFDWNRPGQPTQGGGAGQGFLRVRAIGGRLYVPDADPPYNGFGIFDWGTEGYVFVSNASGQFAPALRPNFRPPGRPTLDGRAGASVLPRAYHVFDVIRFRGQLIASTGAVPPKERAWVGASPGALHVANADLSKFEYAVAYPWPYPGGVWRLTYLVRFRDRLFAGIQDYDGRSPHDYVVVTPPANSQQIAQDQLTAVRVTPTGGAQTVRWYADRNRLYWIAWGRDGVRLRYTNDGEHWELMELPADAGAPTDLVRFRGSLVLLTEWGLYWLNADRPELLGRVTDKKSPFELRDLLCAAPLAVFENELYAGGQRDGSLYQFVGD